MFARIAAFAAALALTACGQPDDAPRPDHSGAMLTVYGEIGVVDRGPVDHEVEPLFAAFDIRFGAACVFRYAALKSLPQYEIRTDFPAGEDRRLFSGPLLRDVLEIAQVRGDTIRVTALDGYQREIEMSRIEAHGVIFAIDYGGRPMDLGGFGPGMIVWLRSTDPDLADMPDDDWVWGIFTLEAFTAEAASESD
jgi:hypothetical protein